MTGHDWWPEQTWSDRPGDTTVYQSERCACGCGARRLVTVELTDTGYDLTSITYEKWDREAE